MREEGEGRESVKRGRKLGMGVTKERPEEK